MEDAGINEGDMRKFFVSYWLLHSAIYNFAQGLSNQEKRRFTWAITNYYYCLVFIGRLMMFLPTDMYYISHSTIVKFLKGEEVRNKRALKLNEVGEFEEKRICANLRNSESGREVVTIEKVSSDLNISTEKIKSFGKILKEIKDFRNRNTYESFVIYAQDNHTVLTEFIFSATDKVREVTEEYLTESCKIFFNFWRKKSEEFVTLLNHKWLIPTTLEILKKHDLAAERMKAIINRGFYFENEEVYQSDLIRVREIMEQKPGVRLSELFEKTCNIDKFGAKQRVMDEIFSNFRSLIEIDRGD